MTEKSTDARLRVEAALDGELDAGHALAFERELAADPELRALYERHAAARAATREFAPRERAPAALRARVMALAAEPTPARGGLAYPLLAMAASLAVVIVAGAIVGYLGFAAPEDDATMHALVAGYMRGQVSGQPFDIASTDRHSVKPWLASRVTLGALVVDLAEQGFPLAGGRIDIVGRVPAPTLVYRRREHVISVTELPASEGVGAWKGAVDGYHVERWSDSERAYVAVSDLDADDLHEFVGLFEKASGAEGRGNPAAN